MLVLSRRKGEGLLIGDDIKITVLNIGKKRITLDVNSEDISIDLQETRTITDDIKIKVAKIDKSQAGGQSSHLSINGIP